MDHNVARKYQDDQIRPDTTPAVPVDANNSRDTSTISQSVASQTKVAV